MTRKLIGAGAVLTVVASACAGSGSDDADPGHGDGPGPSGCATAGADAGSGALSYETFLDPQTAYGPWVRWYWPGDEVEDEQLRADVDWIADAGFGGAEIAVLDASLDPDVDAETRARQLGFDTASYYEHLATAFDQAADRGIRLDLTIGSGYPMASARHAPEDSVQTLMWREWQVEGPASVVLEPVTPEISGMYALSNVSGAVFALNRFLPEEASLVTVFAAEVVGGDRDTTTPFTVLDTLELDPDTLTYLDDAVTAEGIDWDVPPGDWVVTAVFQGPDGEWATDVAEEGDIFVVDHLDAALIESEMEHLFGGRTGLEPYHGSTLRALFTDSFEFKTDRMFSDDFLAEFEERRGYDLLPWLPVVLLTGTDNIAAESSMIDRAPEYLFGDLDERVRYDYSLTLSELFIERYIETIATWSEDRGVEFRAQPYGVEFDAIAAAGAVHIPEAEHIWSGGTEMLLHAMSSGAHLYDRQTTSMEVFIGSSGGMATTPAEVRIAVDKALGGGVNEFVYSGMPYDLLDGYPYPGWGPYNSPFPRRGEKGGTGGEDFGPSHAFADDLAEVNRGVARSQYVMQQGEPTADLLVYYPWFNFPNSIGYVQQDEYLLFSDLPPYEATGRQPPGAEFTSLMFEIEPEARTAWLLELWPVLQELEAAGFTYDFVNDDRLAAASVDGTGISVGERSYRGAVVFDSPTMRPDAADRLATFAEAGGAVLGVGALPTTQPGLSDHESGDARVVAALDRVRAGACFVASDGPTSAVGVTPMLQIGGSADVRVAHRALADGGRVSHVRNITAAPVVATLTPDTACADPYFLDAWRGEAASATGGGEAVTVELGGYESTFFVCSAGAVPADAHVAPWWETSPGDGAAVVELASWEIVAEDGDGGTVDRAGTAPGDWRDDDGLIHARGPATYTTTVDLEFGEGDGVLLDLGWIAGVGGVTVNGTDAGRALVAPFRLDISDLAVDGANTIVVEVVVPLRNYLVGQGTTGEPQWDHYAGLEGTVVGAGLIGPVSVLVGPPG